MNSNDEIERWYACGYDDVYHSALAKLAYRLVYRFMDGPHAKGPATNIIEVGAGNGVFRHEAKPRFKTYTEVDLREWEAMDSSNDDSVRRVIGDAEDLAFAETNSFDRLVATCLLVHVSNPRRALEEWKRVVSPGGSLTIYVPPEAGLMIRVIRAIVMWPKARKLGFNAEKIAYLEHKYSFFHLDALIRDVFDGESIKRRTVPFSWAPFDLALFHSYEILLRDDLKP